MYSARQWLNNIAGLEVRQIIWNLVTGDLHLFYNYQENMDFRGIIDPLRSTKFWTKAMNDLKFFEHGEAEGRIGWKLAELALVEIKRQSDRRGISICLTYRSEKKADEKLIAEYGRVKNFDQPEVITYTFAEKNSTIKVPKRASK